MPRPTQAVTLGELGAFIAGFPTPPPLCADSPTTPGCLPTLDPPIGEYGAARPPRLLPLHHAPHLPASDDYSNISIGRIGLILGAAPDALMDNTAVLGWFDLVRQRITEPLGLHDTFLFLQDATPSQTERLAGGYGQALARALSNGGVSGIALSPGQRLLERAGGPHRRGWRSSASGVGSAERFLA